MDVKGTDRGISAATTSLNNSGDFSLILHKNCDVPTSYLESVANTKRFLERYAGDDIFRAKCENNPQAAVIEYNINVDPIEIRELWDISFSRQSTDEHRPTVAVARFRSFCEEKIAHRDTLRTRKCEPDQPAFQSWRRRQIARMWGSFAPAKVLAIIHSPVSFELNVGCSIGCWFCGVDAAKLRSSFQYTAENALLWNELLTGMVRLIGPSVAQGFCYWATDPLDNPDYEKFIVDFHTITGRCPQTTTAQPQKDITRTRRLLRLSESLGIAVNRFSILSKRILDTVHEQFTPLELLNVELITLNRESILPKALAGRARIRQRSTDPNGFNVTKENQDSQTIACVSGFLINLVEKRIRLITPCNASDRWPLGFWVLDDALFHDVSHALEIIEQMIVKHMRETVHRDDHLRFRPDIKVCNVQVHSCEISTRWINLTFKRNDFPIGRLCELIGKEGFTAKSVVMELETEYGVSTTTSFEVLNLLLQHGVFENEPSSGLQDNDFRLANS